MSDGLTPGPRGRAALSAFLVVLFGLQGALAVRTRLHNDDRYGFAMFHESIRYKLDYHWVMEDGRRVRLRVPKPWLKSRGKKILGHGTTTSVIAVPRKAFAPIEPNSAHGRSSQPRPHTREVDDERAARPGVGRHRCCKTEEKKASAT